MNWRLCGQLFVCAVMALLYGFLLWAACHALNDFSLHGPILTHWNFHG